MKDYIKEFEELDDNVEEVFGKIGQALKGFGQGVSGEPYSDEDADKEKKKLFKPFMSYLPSAGKGMKGAWAKKFKEKAGQAPTFAIGNNQILEVGKELLPLMFELNEAGEYELHYDFERDPYKLRWLLDGNYEADWIGLSKMSTGGPVKGRHVAFKGHWKGGDFKGVMLSPSKISGGYIIDGYYASTPDGFDIPPFNFISKGYSHVGNSILGMPIAGDNKKYKALSLSQVKEGQQIKIVDNNDQEHLLTIEKGLDLKSPDLKINGVEVSWDNYNRSRDNFMKAVMKVGEKFSIPGVVDIPDGIQSIEVKASTYQKKAGKEESKIPTFDMDFEGLEMSGYLDPNVDEEAKANIERFKEDIETGAFLKYIKYLKRLINQKRVDGYGNFPDLAYLWDSKGAKYKQKDPERNATLKYFSDFSKDVINNFVITTRKGRYVPNEDSIEEYESKIRDYLGLSPEVEAPEPEGPEAGGIDRGAAAMQESRLSIKNLVIEIQKKNSK